MHARMVVGIHVYVKTYIYIYIWVSGHRGAPKNVTFLLLLTFRTEKLSQKTGKILSVYLVSTPHQETRQQSQVKPGKAR